jgi:hypothetical protein
MFRGEPLNLTGAGTLFYDQQPDHAPATSTGLAVLLRGEAPEL